MRYSFKHIPFISTLYLLQYYQHCYGSYFCAHDPVWIANIYDIQKNYKLKPITILNQNYNSIESRSERGAYIRPMSAFNNTNQLIPARAYYYFQKKLISLVKTILSNVSLIPLPLSNGLYLTCKYCHHTKMRPGSLEERMPTTTMSFHFTCT